VQVRAESDLGRDQHFTTDGLPCCFFGGRLKVRSGAEDVVETEERPAGKKNWAKADVHIDNWKNKLNLNII